MQEPISPPPPNINHCNQECGEAHHNSMLDGAGLKGQGSQRPKTRQKAKGNKSQLRRASGGGAGGGLWGTRPTGDRNSHSAR